MKTEALKLADEILLCTTDPLHSKTSAMIRRLVEELDEKNYRILELTKRYKALTWNDKQTKCPDCGEVNPAEIHTCSPQTKPLSDEEILKMQDMVPYSLGSDMVKFARAIEERHGIK